MKTRPRRTTPPPSSLLLSEDDRKSLHAKARKRRQADKYIRTIHLHRERESHPLLAGCAYCSLGSAAFSALGLAMTHAYLAPCIPAPELRGAGAAGLSGASPDWGAAVVIFLITWHATALMGWAVRLAGYRLSALAIPPAVLVPLTAVGVVYAKVPIHPTWPLSFGAGVETALCAVLFGTYLGVLHAKIMTAHRT